MLSAARKKSFIQISFYPRLAPWCTWANIRTNFVVIDFTMNAPCTSIVYKQLERQPPINRSEWFKLDHSESLSITQHCCFVKQRKRKKKLKIKDFLQLIFVCFCCIILAFFYGHIRNRTRENGIWCNNKKMEWNMRMNRNKTKPKK